MRCILQAMLLTSALAACGQEGSSAGGDAPSNNAACAALGDATALFGPGAEVIGYPGLEGMAGTCEFASADGARGGDVIIYTVQSLGTVTPETKMTEVLEAWDGATEAPLADADGLGEGAKIATDLPGYQTQIAFRKGDALILIAARSGDAAISGEQLARRMATAASAH